MDVAKEKQKQLKSIFPEVFKEDQIDFEQLQRVLGQWVDQGKEKFGLTWAGKSECAKVIQAPAKGILKPCKAESLNWDTTGNLFIEGENLEVLKILQRSYLGQVKMIYIDPPYNTGKEFIYPDKHSDHLDHYLKYTGQKDVNGNGFLTNVESNGRFHSKWLNMMYVRLYIARSFLRKDGVIFISIDDNEVHHLRSLCDEIFGKENFIAHLIWNNSTGGGLPQKHFNSNNEYILCYGKDTSQISSFYAPMSLQAQNQYNKEDEEGKYRQQQFAWQNASTGENQKYPIEMPDGTHIIPKPGYLYRFTLETFNKKKDQNLIIFKKTKQSCFQTVDGQKTNWSISVKDYLGDGQTRPTTLLPKEYVKQNIEAVKEIKSLFNNQKLIEYTKPTTLLKYLIQIGTNNIGTNNIGANNIGTKKNDIVMDFFAGSGTTAHATMELNAEDGLNRQYICVQLPERCPTKSEAFKAGYKNIADIAKDRIRRATQKIQETHPTKQIDLGFKVFKLDRSCYTKEWDDTPHQDTQLLLDQMREQIDYVDLQLLNGIFSMNFSSKKVYLLQNLLKKEHFKM